MELRSTTQRSWQEDLRQLLPRPAVLAAWLLLAITFVWFHWPVLSGLVGAWEREEDYQHGFVVPIFAAFLLWHRRDMILKSTGRGSWWGVAFLAAWIVLRAVAVYFKFDTLPAISMLFFFAGVALFVSGWQALRWSWPAIVFLFFMLQLPGSVHGLLSQRLQGLAARSSAYVIETLGIPTVLLGHVIQVGNPPEPLDVARACSGLRMLMLFFAMCVAVAFLARRPLWEKLLIVASAAPIAVISNVVRIVLTAILCELARRWPSVVSIEEAREIIHNWVGYVVMMPTGLLLLWLETYLLSKLMIAPLPERPLVVGALAGQQPVASEPAAVKKTRVQE
jgi:exosortase